MNIKKIGKGFKIQAVTDNIMRLTGPAGCGKTAVGQRFALSFGLPIFYIYSCDSVSLNDEMHLLDNPRTVFIDGDFKARDIKKLMPVMLDWAKEGFVFIYVQY